MKLELKFAEQAIRIGGTAAAPMFVAADVCAALEIQNSRNVFASLDAYEKGVQIVDTLGGPQQMQAVTESGLYHLIFKSRKPAAKAFRRWVTEEVLPMIRKTGQYVPAARELAGAAETLTMPQWLAELGLSLIKDTATCELLGARVGAAIHHLRFVQASFRERDGFQAIPRPVLELAEGLFRRDCAAPVNRHFFETAPVLADAGQR
jgi:prophage antirepressor-like protein